MNNKETKRKIQQECIERHDRLVMECVDEVAELILRGITLLSDDLFRLADLYEQEALYENTGQSLMDISNEAESLAIKIGDVRWGKVVTELINDDISSFEIRNQKLFQECAGQLCRETRMNLKQIKAFHMQIMFTCRNNYSRYLYMTFENLEKEVNQVFFTAQNAMNEMYNKYGIPVQEEIIQETNKGAIHSTIQRVVSCRELEKLVQDNGYTYKGSHGSHRKYEALNGDVIVIPFHPGDMKKGLAIRIQKDLQNNNV